MATRRLQDPATGEWFDVEISEQGETAEPGGPSSNADFAWRRQQEKKVREAEEQVAAMQRETAFLRNGINPATSPRMADFVKAYDGELTDAAIRAAAEARGFVEVPDTPAQPAASGQQPVDPTKPPTQEELAQIDVVALAAQQRMSQASIGASGVAPAGMEGMKAALDQGDTAFARYLQEQGVPVRIDGQD